jgi:predicted phage replisome organizer
VSIVAKSDKKYYWLRLQKDFFKRHDIRIVESMPNGKDYILFYLKVICESANHGGNLRFSETIPYSEEMLATITNTNVDVVRNAIKIFQELNMIEVLDNGTYFMHEVQNMVGYETEWAIKKREYRKKVNAQNVLQSENNAIKALKGGQYEDNVLNVRTNKGQCPKKEDNVRQEKEKEIEKEIDINNNIYIAQSDKITHEPTPIEPSVITITLNDKSEYPIYQSMIDEWNELYPNVDVLQELRKMKGWSNANPAKRKTKKGIQRFINAWLAREQDKPRKIQQQTTKDLASNLDFNEFY